MKNKLQGRFPYTVPNYHVNTGYDRLTMGSMPWQESYATNQAKEEPNIDRLWETVARNIAYEQAIKEEQKEALNRETVRMIKELEEYDKARKTGRDVRSKTEIQGLHTVSYQPNEMADNYEPRMQVDDYNLYEANALPYKQGGVQFGIWRGGSPSQYVTFASDYGEPKRWYETSVGETHMFGYLPPLEIEPVSSEELESIKTIVGKAATIAGSLVGNAFLNSVIEIAMSCMPPYAKAGLYILIMSYGVYKCAEKAYEEAINEYMRGHSCSREVAKENIVPTGLFVKKLVVKLGEEGANLIVDQLPGIGIKGKAGLQAVFGQVAEIVEKKFSCPKSMSETGGSFNF